LEEKVAIDAGNTDEFFVANRKDISKGLDSGRGGCDTLCDGYKGGLVVVDFVEQTLSRGRFVFLVAIGRLLLARSLVKLPIATEDQEETNLNAENDSCS
jgi:hypothetical protein